MANTWTRFTIWKINSHPADHPMVSGQSGMVEEYLEWGIQQLLREDVWIPDIKGVLYIIKVTSLV